MSKITKLFVVSLLLSFNFAPDLNAMSKFKRLFSCCFGCKKDDEIDQDRLDSGVFACLPDEICLEILEKFSDKELMQASVMPVCKRTQRLVEYELHKRAPKIARRFIDQLLSPSINAQDLATIYIKFRAEFMTMPKKTEILVQQNFEQLMRNLLDKEFKKQDCLNGDFFNMVVLAIGGKEFSLLCDVITKKIEAGDLRARQLDNYMSQIFANQPGLDLSHDFFKDLSEEQSKKFTDQFTKIIEIVSIVCHAKLLICLLRLNVDEKCEIIFSFLKDITENIIKPVSTCKSKDELLENLNLFCKKLSDFLGVDVVPLKEQTEELKALFYTASTRF